MTTKTFLEELEEKGVLLKHDYKSGENFYGYQEKDVQETYDEWLSKKKKDILDDIKAWMKGRTKDINFIERIIEKYLGK